jgi:hypothetical protein
MNRRSQFMSVLVLLGFSILAVGIGAATAPAALAPVADFTKDQVLNNRAMEVGGEVQAALRAADADHLGGTSIVPDGLEIQIVGPVTAKMQAVLSAQAKSGVKIRVVSVRHSQKELDRATDLIGRVNEALIADGIVLGGWGPDYTSNMVVAHLQHYDPDVARRLRERFPHLPLVVSTKSEIAVGAASRTADTAPWWVPVGCRPSLWPG